MYIRTLTLQNHCYNNNYTLTWQAYVMIYRTYTSWFPIATSDLSNIVTVVLCNVRSDNTRDSHATFMYYSFMYKYIILNYIAINTVYIKCSIVYKTMINDDGGSVLFNRCFSMNCTLTWLNIMMQLQNRQSQSVILIWNHPMYICNTWLYFYHNNAKMWHCVHNNDKWRWRSCIVRQML